MSTLTTFYKWLCDQKHRLDPCGRFYHLVSSFLEDKNAKHQPPIRANDVHTWINFLNNIQSTLDVSGDFLIAYAGYMKEYNLEDDYWHGTVAVYLTHVDRLLQISKEMEQAEPMVVAFAQSAAKAVEVQREILTQEAMEYEMMYKNVQVVLKKK